MFRFLGDIENAPVVDLSTGRTIAQVVDVIVNPHDLSIGALVCYSRKDADNLYLQTQDIHEFSADTFVVQTSEALAPLSEVMRIQELVEINYRIIGKSVRTESKKRVGVVSEVAFDDKSFYFEKYYVRPPVTKMLRTDDLIVGRNQIVEVSDKVIIVKDSSIMSGKKVAFGAEA